MNYDNHLSVYKDLCTFNQASPPSPSNDTVSMGGRGEHKTGNVRLVPRKCTRTLLITEVRSPAEHDLPLLAVCTRSRTTFPFHAALQDAGPSARKFQHRHPRWATEQAPEGRGPTLRSNQNTQIPPKAKLEVAVLTTLICL